MEQETIGIGQEEKVVAEEALFTTPIINDDLVAESQVVEERYSNSDDFSFNLDCFDEKEQEDTFWQAKTGLNKETLCGAIETIIFMSEKPISLTKIKSYIDNDLPLRVIHESIEKLQNEYEQKHHGIRLQEVAEGYQFRTKATYSKYVQDVLKISSLMLSPAALEVLAIIAYKQPISKSDIEKIRGVDSSHLVRALMDKKLVKITGRSDELGKPTLYGTTIEFLEVFNLRTIQDLPSEHELADLANGNEIGKISDIKEIIASEKGKFTFDDIEELDSLKKTINSISADTDFTKTLNSSVKKEGSDLLTVSKSAFELLEEYIYKKPVSEANISAGKSETLSPDMGPRVVDVEGEEGLINAPIVEESAFLNADSIIREESSQDVASDEAELMAEVDQAYENLFGEKEDDNSSSSFSENRADLGDDALDDLMDDLDNKTESIKNSAKDYGIDLDFMNEASFDNSGQQDEDPNTLYQ